jgi:hypothetical protein
MIVWPVQNGLGCFTEKGLIFGKKGFYATEMKGGEGIFPVWKDVSRKVNVWIKLTMHKKESLFPLRNYKALLHCNHNFCFSLK